MTQDRFRPTHRQLVSAVLCLVTDTGVPTIPAYLGDLGYSLHGLELSMVDVHGRRYTPDLFIANLERDNLVLVDCKTWGPMIHEEQISRYMRTSKKEVVTLSGITPRDLSVLTHDALFVVMEDAETEIVNAVAKCKNPRCDGMGIVLVSSVGLNCPHNALSDVELSVALNGGWQLDIQQLELERLPFDPSSPSWELAEAIFQTLFSMWLQGTTTFTVDDVCINSNEWWPYFHSGQQALRKRVQRELRIIAKFALKEWIEAVRDVDNRVTSWRFKKSPSQRKDVHDGYRRRQDRYLDVRAQQRGVTAADFEDIDRDQLALIPAERREVGATISDPN